MRHPGRAGVNEAMKTLPVLLAAVSVAALAACSTASSSSSAPVAGAPLSPPPAASSVPVPSPLALGQFPATTDGSLAKAVCVQWQGLRDEYAHMLGLGDPPGTFNAWFSSPAWSKAQADMTRLGSDPAFGKLETAYGLATFGGSASVPNAALLDAACAKAD